MFRGFLLTCSECCSAFDGNNISALFLRPECHKTASALSRPATGTGQLAGRIVSLFLAGLASSTHRAPPRPAPGPHHSLLTRRGKEKRCSACAAARYAVHGTAHLLAKAHPAPPRAAPHRPTRPAHASRAHPRVRYSAFHRLLAGTPRRVASRIQFAAIITSTRQTRHCVLE